MWYNSLLARGLIPDWVLRRGVRSQGKERLNMMKKGNAEKLYSDFLNEASYGSIAVNTDDANNQHYEVDAEFFQYCLGKNLKYSCSVTIPFSPTLRSILISLGVSGGAKDW